MRQSNVSRILVLVTAVFFSFLATITFNTHVQASQPSDVFKCVLRSGDTPVTRVIAKDGVTEKDLIKYKETYFSGSGYTPETRCLQITSRLNVAVASAKENGKITTIGLTNRHKNGYEVICVADGRKSECNSLILTLKPGRNAIKEGREIMNSMRTQNSGETYVQGPGSIFVRLYPFLTK